MITNRKEYFKYLEADRVSLGRKPIKFFSTKYFKSFLVKDYIWNFQRLLRRCEYYHNCRKDFFGIVYYYYLLYKYKRLSLLLGFEISINTIGPGLSIAHTGSIVINKGTRIGKNCRLHAGVNIGTAAGFADNAPTIGDNVYIGPGAKIFGKIIIADRVAIGANSVVNKSIINSDISVAGVPAKTISNKIDIFKFLIAGTDA